MTQSDVAAVTALVHRYAELLDAGDLNGVAELFARAAWRSPQHPEGLRGVDAVRRAYDGVRLYNGSPRTKHVISNLVVDVNPSARTGRARCSFAVLQAVNSLALQPVLVGRYHDAFACDDAGWHFTERVTLVDMAGDLNRHFRGARTAGE